MAPIEHSRSFSLKGNKEEWTEKLQSEIKHIIQHVIEVNLYISEDIKQRLVGKAMVVTTEVLNNLYKYEKKLHIYLGVNFDGETLTVHYKFPGDALNISKVYDRIQECQKIYADGTKSKSVEFLLGGNRGFYYMSKAADTFNLQEINEDEFKREIIVAFSIENAKQFLLKAKEGK